MIEVSQLTYTYPERRRPALSSVNLDVGRGERMLLAGRSGSGKSTLLRTLNGLVPHFHGGRFAGRVVVAGLDTRRAAPLELAGHVGMAFQEPLSRFVTGSVLDEIAFTLEAARLPRGALDRRIEDAVDRLGLGPLANRPLEALSGGEQQRVAIGVALARRPSLLLLDEPISQLDGPSAAGVGTWVAELCEQLGLTAVIAEHRLERIAPAVDRVAQLSEDGRLILDGPAADVFPRLEFPPAGCDAARRLGLAWPLEGEGLADALRRWAWAAAPNARQAETPGAPLLEAQGVSFAYDGLPALTGVDLALRQGEVVGLVGRNGAGKSTLLRVLMGLLRPASGEVRLEGRSVRGMDVAQVARRVAYVPQWPGALLFADTVRAELIYTLSQHGLERNPPEDPDFLLERLGLRRVAGHYPRDLSSGERQRAALAAVLVVGPKVILLDEPTLGMDPQEKSHLAGLISSWRAQGAAVLLATHDVDTVARLAQRVILLEAGRVADAGPAAETLFAHPDFQTSLQHLSGQARPATPEELGESVPLKEVGYADD